MVASCGKCSRWQLRSLPSKFPGTRNRGTSENSGIPFTPSHHRGWGQQLNNSPSIQTSGTAVTAAGITCVTSHRGLWRALVAYGRRGLPVVPTTSPSGLTAQELVWRLSYSRTQRNTDFICNKGFDVLSLSSHNRATVKNVCQRFMRLHKSCILGDRLRKGVQEITQRIS